MQQLSENRVRPSVSQNWYYCSYPAGTSSSETCRLTRAVRYVTLLKWAGLVPALVATFVPLASVAATSLKVETSGAVLGFHTPEQLRGYLTVHMAEAQPVNWRFDAAATGDAPAPDRVKWRFKLRPYAGGEVRNFVPPVHER